MRKYMKYEIKGTYKFILGILLVVLIASTVIQLNIQSEMSGGLNGLQGSGFKALMLVTSILVIFGAFLIAFFYIIGSFRKELYDDRGYLTFTLPLTGNQILGSKLLVSMLWYVVLGAGIVLYNILLSFTLFGRDWTYLINTIFENLDISLISFVVVGILSTITTLILIYFSIALSRVSIKNKRIGGIWFIVFIILNMIITYISFKIGELLPYYLSLDGFSIKHLYDINILNTNPMDNNGSLMIIGANFKSYINIFGNLFQIGVMVAGFLGTGYLIEKKIDL